MAISAAQLIRMPSLFSAEQLRAHEQALFAEGETALGLMTQAGSVLWSELRARWPQAQRIGVLIGSGQNAGDGLILARLARAAGCTVVLFGWFDPQAVQGACSHAWAQWQTDDAQGMQIPDANQLAELDVIVDAGFGIGFTLNRPIEGAPARWIAAVNGAHQQGVGVISADLPSGLAADTGAGDLVIHADVTLCFLALKLGLFTGRGPAVAGEIIWANLNQPAPVATGVAQLLLNVPPLPAKPRDGHKGSFGCVLVIAGNEGMAGAARMAAEAALRMGAGKVIVATHPAHAAVLGVGCPELIVQGITDAAQLAALLPLADSLVLGPGLGQDDWAQALADCALRAPCPMIVDADGLVFLRERPSPSLPQSGVLIITPHPAEAARLLGCTPQTVERDRLHAARALAQRFGALTLLKGAGSVLALPDELLICGRGSPALATAGSGDVLAGVIGGLLAIGVAAGLDARAVLTRAVCWHALAGEQVAAESGAWGAAATDLLPPIRALANGISASMPRYGLIGDVS
ncbi:MAG: NAD(P)H-hydrate dehydratase [Halothiobacillaceae bacterium]|nr:NAD(P)H-hydrate dehydratase [Halothiobacillaceae bacterium]